MPGLTWTTEGEFIPRWCSWNSKSMMALSLKLRTSGVSMQSYELKYQKYIMALQLTELCGRLVWCHWTTELLHHRVRMKKQTDNVFFHTVHVTCCCIYFVVFTLNERVSTRKYKSNQQKHLTLVQEIDSSWGWAKEAGGDRDGEGANFYIIH